MSESECETEAAQNLVRAKEYAHTLDIEMPLNVFGEPEDRVTVRGADWLMTAYRFQKQAGALELAGQMREYTYG